MTMRHIESQEGLRQFINDPNKVKAELARSLIERAKTWREQFGEIALPSAIATSATPEVVEPQPVKAEPVKIYPEISLQEERIRQIRKRIELEFHTKLGKTEEEYAKRFPEFTPEPESSKGKLGIVPVLVETEISPEDQCKMAGIDYLSSGLSRTDWNKTLKGYETPKAPYVAWLEDGRNNLDRKPADVRKDLKKSGGFGGTELEGIALFISNPEILDHHSLDLPGTAVGSDGSAFLYLWRGRPKLSVRLAGNADPGFGSVVRGSQK